MLTSDQYQAQLKRQQAGQRNFVWKFFEALHHTDGLLEENFKFKQNEVFTDLYITQLLSVGLPDEFQAHNQESGSSSARGRSSARASATPSKGANKHLELQIFSNLKSFFQERDIDCSNVLTAIREAKEEANLQVEASGDVSGRGEPQTPALKKVYWQLFYVIFVAFYMDSKQNEYLCEYFANRLPKDILSVKHALDIVQSLLDKAEITYTEPPTEESTFFDQSESHLENEDESLSPSLRDQEGFERAKNDNSDDFLELDPIDDIARISQIHEQVESARKSQLKKEFDLANATNVENQRQQEYEQKKAHLEQSMSEMEAKLQKKQMKNKNREQLIEQELMSQIEDKKRQRDALNNYLSGQDALKEECEDLKIQDIQIDTQLLDTINLLQEEKAMGPQIENELRNKESQLRQLELERQRLNDEIRMRTQYQDFDNTNKHNHLHYEDQLSPGNDRTTPNQLLSPQNAEDNHMEFNQGTDYNTDLVRRAKDSGSFRSERSHMDFGGVDSALDFEYQTNDTHDQDDVVYVDSQHTMDMDYETPREGHSSSIVHNPSNFQTSENKHDHSFALDSTERKCLGKNYTPDYLKDEADANQMMLTLAGRPSRATDTEMGVLNLNDRLKYAGIVDEEMGINSDNQTVWSKGEKEQLMDKYLQRSVELQKDIDKLQRQLARVVWLQRNAGKLKCSRKNLESWTDVRNYTRERWIKLAITTFIIILVFLLMISFA